MKRRAVGLRLWGMRAFLTGGMILAGMGWRKLIIDDVKLLIEEAGSRAEGCGE